MSIKYRSNVDSSAQDRGLHHLQIPSTLGGAPTGDGRGHGRHPQSVYDIVLVPPGTTPALLLSVRSGRRTGKVKTNRIAKGDELDAGARPLLAQPRRGALVPLRAEALRPGTGRERCIVFRQRRMYVISTLHCRCPNPLSRGTTLRKAHAVHENRAPAQKSR